MGQGLSDTLQREDGINAGAQAFLPAQAPASEPASAQTAITEEDVAAAAQTLLEYKKAKSALEKRIVENESWWKLQHWNKVLNSKYKTSETGEEPTSAWLQNCISNKHADIMDNFPAPSILPREESDQDTARQLSDILPVILDQNGFEQTYSDMSWYKLKTGTGVTGVFWNPRLNNGLGDVDIKKLDLLNLFWEPGIADIQDSKNLFIVTLVDHDDLALRYPEQLAHAGASQTIDVTQYAYDETIDTSKKTVLVDWYYKRMVNGKTVLHLCKFACGRVLYASENEAEYAARGFYDHGRYPVVFDTLFAEEGSPAGYGYIDVCKSPQTYIDKLNQAILLNAITAARPRWFVRGDGKINEEEYADWSKQFIHYNGAGRPSEDLHPIQSEPLPSIYVTVLRDKIEELKETSGNRDFNQGSTSGGVTSGAAIAALQEAGSKTSRDMIKSSYRAFSKVCELIIELMRQFYDAPRCFRILGPNGDMQFRQFSNQGLKLQQLELGFRLPVFDISIKAQKASPFSTAVENERALGMFGNGMFKPDLAEQALIALEMMTFEGKDEVAAMIRDNSAQQQQMQMMQQQMVQMKAALDRLQGMQSSPEQLHEMMGGAPAIQGTPRGISGKEVEANSIGDPMTTIRGSTTGAARKQAAQAAMPRN